MHIAPHLSIFPGHINTGVIRDGGRALLIDFGDGSVMPALHAAGIEIIDTILFTHHHRDQACGAQLAVGAKLLVPAEEQQWFDAVDAYWVSPACQYLVFKSFRPSRPLLAEPLRVDGVLRDGDVIEWGPARITALPTPGHSDGSLSYLVEVDGTRVAFTGDLIYDAGRLWECYSLQKGYGLLDYHAFLGDRDTLLNSLQRVLTAKPEMLVPSHGNVMREPEAAVNALQDNLRRAYDNYAAISALRYYNPEVFPGYLDGPNVMPIRPVVPPPAWLRKFSTSWVIVSESGAAFVTDCSEPVVVEELQRWQANGKIAAIEGLWITHTHFDHTGGAAAFRQTFNAPVYADASVAQVISDPRSWRVTCLAAEAVQVDHWTEYGERWQWHEFTLTAYHYPGQALYHGGLLVEGRGLRVFISGDSHTPSGIDDYCAQNRNFLGESAGFDRCLALLQQLKPDLIFNQHVDSGFAYTDADLAYMRANLAERERLFGALFPWEHANFGIDDSWAYCYPYAQDACPGEDVPLAMVIINHAAESMRVACRPALPRAWGIAADEVETTIPARHEQQLALTLPVPEDAPSGRYVIPVDITLGDRHLPQFTEAIIDVKRMQ